jgi:hypothetical protein
MMELLKFEQFKNANCSHDQDEWGNMYRFELHTADGFFSMDFEVNARVDEQDSSDDDDDD